MLYADPFLTVYCCLLAALLGACMGSFLNCAAWRIVHGESVLRGRSHCDACGHVLAVRDLIPVVSYLAAHGRCRYCGAKLSRRHVLAEAVSALVFVTLLLHYDISLQALEGWCVAGILLVSFAITAILEHGQAQPEELPTVTANGTAQNILAPLPMQGAADSTADSAVSGGENAAAEGTPAVTLEQFGPARQTAGAYSVKAYDSSVIRQPASGQVDLSYFSDAAFLGDSLTVGFSDYKINLGGALICGYTGVGPDAIVNRSAVKSSVRGEEVALDVLAAAQPKKLYILLGTNTLTTVGAADRFLAYYGQMLDVLRQTLGEDCVIYVESIPPVRPEAAAEKPGLASDIIRSVNEQLALLAADKGCVYLDLWETLADGEGNLKEVLAAPDGVHFSAGNGYGAWVTYLRNHAKYSADNAWTPGSAYAG